MINNSANHSCLIIDISTSKISSTVGLMHRIFAILVAASIRAAPFAPIDQGATAAH
jgi:hypothetical protein